MNPKKYGDFTKTFNLVNNKITDDFIDDLYNYLQQYRIITEINATFLTVPDPVYSRKVQDIVSKLNEKSGEHRYSAVAPYISGEGSLKCIYDTSISSQLLESIITS